MAAESGELAEAWTGAPEDTDLDDVEPTANMKVEVQLASRS